MKTATARVALLNAFLHCVQKYKASSRSADTRVVRFISNTRRLGISYILYRCALFRPSILRGSVRAKLFFGQQMELPANDIGAHVLRMYGILPHRSERKQTFWLLKNLKDTDVFYDVGAHHGYYTALAGILLQRGRVHAFEANKKLCGYLLRNVCDQKNIDIVHTAVADATKKVDFYDMTTIADSSVSSRFNLLHSTVVPHQVDAISLDEYVQETHSIPTVIKFDIEGGEYDAICGAQNSIQRHKPKILMEVLGNEQGETYSKKAVQKLQELGYQAFALEGDGVQSPTPTASPVESIQSMSRDARDNFLFIAI